MKKQIATLLALSTAAACILTYQPTAVGAEEYSVLDNTDKLVQEALEDNTDELEDALYDSVTEEFRFMRRTKHRHKVNWKRLRLRRECTKILFRLQIIGVPYKKTILQKEYLIH